MPVSGQQLLFGGRLGHGPDKAHATPTQFDAVAEYLQLSHLIMVTVVPRATLDTIENSSTSRLQPGNPIPRPEPVLNPSCIASSIFGMPGPSSRAMTLIPW